MTRSPVGIVGTDVSDKIIASIIKFQTISELGIPDDGGVFSSNTKLFPISIRNSLSVTVQTRDCKSKPVMSVPFVSAVLYLRQICRCIISGVGTCCDVRCEVFTAVTIQNAVDWVTPCGSSTDVSEECIATIIKVISIGELGTMLAISENRSTMRRKYDRI
jgi:hypothetical protein